MSTRNALSITGNYQLNFDPRDPWPEGYRLQPILFLTVRGLIFGLRCVRVDVLNHFRNPPRICVTSNNGKRV